VVLVIDNNLYRLMVALSFSYRFCSYAMLEPYVALSFSYR
jgi:hypothetical protein